MFIVGSQHGSSRILLSGLPFLATSPRVCQTSRTLLSMSVERQGLGMGGGGGGGQLAPLCFTTPGTGLDATWIRLSCSGASARHQYGNGPLGVPQGTLSCVAALSDSLNIS